MRDSMLKMKFLWTGFVVLLSATMMTGCSKDEEKNVEIRPDIHQIVLSADGVGPLNATTSFNMHQMTVAFSDFSVEEIINFQNKIPYPVIRVSSSGHTLLTINPDASRRNIYSVIVEDNTVKNSLGHALGSSYSSVYAYGQTEKCQPGTDDMAGRVLCYAPQNPNVLYSFYGQWNGPDGQMPSADVLHDFVLESIIWRPKISS